jgi:hypothetical protein
MRRRGRRQETEVQEFRSSGVQETEFRKQNSGDRSPEVRMPLLTPTLTLTTGK